MEKKIIKFEYQRYAILSDPQKRAEYDTKGVNGVRDRPTYLLFVMPFHYY